MDGIDDRVTDPSQLVASAHPFAASQPQSRLFHLVFCFFRLDSKRARGLAPARTSCRITTTLVFAAGRKAQLSCTPC